MPDDLDELPGGLRRLWSTASLTGKLGARAASRVLFRKNHRGDENNDLDLEAAAATSATAVAAARKLVTHMGNLKGLVMKAGQIASYMPGALPPAAQEVLAELQAQSTPMAYARIAEVIRAELGAPAGELFEAFDDRPFAAASIGQVHRARYLGAAVAVKVQYPGIEAAIRSDLKTVGVIARLSSIGSPLDGAALAGELRDRLLEECDYAREATSQTLFARLLAGVDGAAVPAVVAERSRRRVLTTTFVEGTSLADTPPGLRDRAGRVIFRACFELLFRRCIYNADPHPGNYLVGPDGVVTFLDFGCIRRFDPCSPSSARPPPGATSSSPCSPVRSSRPDRRRGHVRRRPLIVSSRPDRRRGHERLCRGPLVVRGGAGADRAARPAPASARSGMMPRARSPRVTGRA